MPLISVIVPIYKVEKYIDRCVESILAQSFTDFELILVDDGSPDNCPQICDEYAKKDSRIKVVHKQNGGLSDARNAGIDVAKGEWLAFIDSDDYVHEDYLGSLYNAAAENGADLAICDFVRVNDDENVIEKDHSFDGLVTEDKNTLFEYMYSNWRIRPAWNKLYKKEIFSELRFAFGKIHEDEFAIHHVLYNCRKAVIIKDGLYYYRIRQNSIMTTESPKSILDGFEAIIEQYEFCAERKVVTNNLVTGINYLNVVSDMEKRMDKQNIHRYKALKSRYEKIYFSKDSNKSLKRFLNFYCNKTYRKLQAKKH